TPEPPGAPGVAIHWNRPHSTGVGSLGRVFHTHSSSYSDGMSLPHLHAFLAHIERERCAFSIEGGVGKQFHFPLEAVNPEHAQVSPDARSHAAALDRVDGVAREPELRGHVFL